MRVAIAIIAVQAAACATILGGDFDDKRPESLTEEDGGGAASSSSSTSSSSSSGSTSSSSSSSSSGTSGDGGGTSSGSSSGTPKSCTGTAAACATLATMGECSPQQQGCSWATANCRVTSPCDQQVSTSACDQLPGCAIDLTVPGGTNPCQPIKGYCAGTTKAACESKQACRFTGGCTGTATSCASITVATTCAKQEGCTWQ